MSSVSDTVFGYLREKREKRERSSLLPADNIHCNASDALGCARAIGLKAAKVPESNPPGRDSLWNFEMGDAAEEVILDALAANPYPGQVFQREWALDWLSGRADLTFEAKDGRGVVGEVKSASEWAFEQATIGQLVFPQCEWDEACKTGASIIISDPEASMLVCAAHEKEAKKTGWERTGKKERRDRTPPAGAKMEHIVQAGLTAYATAQEHLERVPPLEYVPGNLVSRAAQPVDFGYMMVIYGRKTGTKGELSLFDWKLRYETYQPVVEEEAKRLMFIVNMARNGSILQPNYQGKMLDPKSMIQENRFPCSYCARQSICLRLDPTEIVDIPVVSTEEAAFFKASAA